MLEKYIERYLKDGKIKVFPSKRKNKDLILDYIITKFETNKRYTEKQINEIIQKNLEIDAVLLVRRELVDRGLLARETDGSSYWRT